MFGGIYRNKKVLVTGHTGFKGGWLSLWLHQLGAEVSGFSLPPPAEDTLFHILPPNCFTRSIFDDLRDEHAINKAVAESNADVIFHLAAQPIVGTSYREPISTFTTNALGTALLLEAVRKAGSSAAIVVVTSDKCYLNDNSGRPFIETDALGGHDVYSMSKAATEMVVTAWHSSFFSKQAKLGPLATARAGNVIGGGDYAEDRIIPDAVRAFEYNQPLVLRRPQATRPWQHVLESLSGYLALGQRILSEPDCLQLMNFNFGPEHEAERSVQDLMNAWLKGWPGAFDLQIMPEPTYGEATRLSLNHSKAKEQLGWLPVWDFYDTVSQTTAWYRQRHENKSSPADMLAFTHQQIALYCDAARSKGAAWTA
ncbi:CDP-glucose 4,6-dehydratase [Prosthecobacter sp. SYSU 5D2]|uniref:CDP-glucose 4,6-dehydratase n=1 Tax=Prosthecobacter sp. SYSU 5D2 TaxID=3134134 RepID=UPI0031FF0867